ncbi:MAG: glycoside hydrolase family 3 C-terminal domain-containing protein [Bacteroidales bacterium]|nr:glycoside hydrolase family 3 C-terminal domain-containing protein [Bacteroidales bacterium]
MKITPLLLATLILAGCGGRTPLYKNAGRSAEERADDLLKRMTVDEKLGQLVCPLGWPMYDKVSADSVTISDQYRDFIQNQHGGMLWAVFRADPWTKKTLENGLNPTLAAKAYNALQRYAIDSTRLGIPIILAEEAPHGHMAIGTTVFPTSIGLASTWDTELVEKVGQTIGTELQAQGATIGYGPVIDLSREPRWSRVEETYGEDVHLTSQMASAMVRGTSSKGVISTLKHFVAYGVPEGGHNGNPSIIGMRDLRENVLPTFKAAIDAGALSVMTSYNSLDGIPTTCNKDLLTGVLRDEWGFKGFVVSDLESIDGIARDHKVAASPQEAGEMALNAGVDVDLGAHCYAQLKESVDKGRVSMKTLDQAVKRVLIRKFEAGLFDHPYVDEATAAGLVRTPEHLEVAAQAAREGIVLLKNDGVLPLKSGTRIALIGPNADNQYNQLGDYTAPQAEENVVTMLDGLRAKGADVLYVKGCSIRDTRDSQIAQAAIAAMLSDVAVVVVGGSSARDFKTKYIDTGAAVVDEDAVSDMEAGEGFDRACLDLLGLQSDLLKAVRAAGKPVVVVYVEGRPLDKNWAAEKADALLTMWYPGGEGGTALADVLFGDYNPAGRLPVSVPRNVGQLPVYYNKKNPRGHDYVEMSADPLYPFGYGLSYTTFEYSDLTVSGRVPDVEVTVNVKNTGTRDGDEVVQLYVIDPLASTVRPRKQLRAFDRVFVKVGETVPVTLKLGPDAFSLVDAAGKTVIERGDFILEVGASSEDTRLKETITY